MMYYYIIFKKWIATMENDGMINLDISSVAEVIFLQIYKGKNGLLFLMFLVIYNVAALPALFGELNVWWVMLWIVYYGLNIIWVSLLIRNYIELYDDYFIFYYGFTKESFDLTDIVELKRSKNPIASSANSLDRIHVVTVNKDFYISLKDNDGFIKAVLQRKNNITMKEAISR